MSARPRLWETLASLGYTVRGGGPVFEIALEIWCSVRVSTAGGILRLEPRFGIITRKAATWLTAIFIILLYMLSWFIEDRVRIFLTIFLFITVVWDACRYILTENAMNLVRLIHLQQQQEKAAADSASDA